MSDKQVNPDTLDAILATEDPVEDEDLDAAFASGFSESVGGDQPQPATTEPVEKDTKEELKPDDGPKDDDEGGEGEAKKSEGEDDDAGKNEEPDKDKEKPKVDEPEQKDEYTQKLEKRLRSLEAQFGTLNSKYMTLAAKKAQNQTEAEGAKTPSTEAIREAIEDENKLAALKQEFPEYADALEAQSRLVEKRIKDELESKIPKADSFEEQFNALREETNKLIQDARQAAIIDIKYPGWQDTCASPAFNEWLGQQDDDTKALATSDYGADVVQLLDTFHEKGPAKKQDRLKNAITPTNRSSVPKPKVESEEDAFAAGFKSVR